MPTIRFETKDTRARLALHRLALHRETPHTTGTLRVASVWGPQQTCRALAAVLQSDSKVRLEVISDDETSEQIQKWDGKYRVLRSRLDSSIWNFLVVAMDDQLLLDQGHLWQRLMGPCFTTPLLPIWLEYVRGRLAEDGLLVDLDCHNCGCQVLNAEDSDLDRIVSEGLMNGRITIGKWKEVCCA